MPTPKPRGAVLADPLNLNFGTKRKRDSLRVTVSYVGEVDDIEVYSLGQPYRCFWKIQATSVNYERSFYAYRLTKPTPKQLRKFKQSTYKRLRLCL